MTALVQSDLIEPVLRVALRGDAALTALVPADRIYPETVPANVAWPFIKFGPWTDDPQRHDGLAGTVDGSVSPGSVHVFAKASAAHPDPARFCKQVNRHVARVLEAIEGATIAGEPALSVTVEQSQEIQDGDEAGARHGFVLFSAYAF